MNNPKVEHGSHRDGDAVAGGHVLGRNFHLRLPQADPHNAIHSGDDPLESRCLNPPEMTEAKYDTTIAFSYDPNTRYDK
jgi:hypothetical protein